MYILAYGSISWLPWYLTATADRPMPYCNSLYATA